MHSHHKATLPEAYATGRHTLRHPIVHKSLHFTMYTTVHCTLHRYSNQYIHYWCKWHAQCRRQHRQRIVLSITAVHVQLSTTPAQPIARNKQNAIPSHGNVLALARKPTETNSTNDPSAGSPTETLLRLLLPLSNKVQSTYCTTLIYDHCAKPSISPDYSIGRSDGRCVQRAGT